MATVELINWTPNPELIVAASARSCIVDAEYGDISDQLAPADIDRLIATVIAKGHHSVLEHASFTFALSDVSRVLTHQLVRHRIASYSQLSQQRTDARSLAFVVPPDVRRNSALATKYAALMEDARSLYEELADSGIAIGSARYVLPSAFVSRVIFTMNARSLFNLIAQRECAAEEWEFRQVATAVHRELVRIAPAIFRHAGPKCETDGICPEGEVGLSCSRGVHTGAAIRNTREEIVNLISL